MAEWSFEYPIAFVVILLFLLLERFAPARVNSIVFPQAELLKSLSKASSNWLWLLRLLIFMLLAVALSSPIKQNDMVLESDKGYEISLILDASGSMEQADKFAIVKDIVLDFIDKREHDKLALTLFADFAYVAVPLTFDKRSIKMLLERVDVGVAGVQRTALYEALFMSSKLFKGSHSKHKIAILLTDGIDNTSKVPLSVAIDSAKKHGITLYVIGVGSRGDYDARVLRRIAKETGGEFYEANSVKKLEQIYAEIDSLEKSDIEIKKYMQIDYFYQYPLALAILMLVIYVWLRRRNYAV